jgi:3-oxoadipate enol-lactonase
MKRFASCAGWIFLAVAVSRVASSQVSLPEQHGKGSFLPVEGSKLYFEECGSGRPTIILIHDGVVDSAVWDNDWPAFCKEFHTVRYDRRGYGQSPAATTWYSEIDDLAALMHHLSVSSAVLVGSSHGGQLSIDFALAHPDAVQQLVLIGPVVTGLPFSTQFLDRGKHAFELAGKGNLKEGIAEWSKDPYLIAPQNETARKRLFDLLTASPQDMTHPDYPLANKPALPRLHEIRVPTLILVGDADIPDVHAQAGAIEAGIPNARRVIVEGVGHLMYLEKPDEVSRLVISFIRQNMF